MGFVGRGEGEAALYVGRRAGGRRQVEAGQRVGFQASSEGEDEAAEHAPQRLGWSGRQCSIHSHEGQSDNDGDDTQRQQQ